MALWGAVENFFGGLANGAENLLGLNKKQNQDQNNPNPAPNSAPAPSQPQNQPNLSNPDNIAGNSPIFQGADLQKATAAPAPPKPQQPTPPPSEPQPAVPNFLQLAKAPTPISATPPPIDVPKVNMPLETAKQFLGGVGQSAVNLVKSAVVDPALRGGRALTSLQNTGSLGESPLQFGEDVAQTGLNATGLPGLAEKGAVALGLDELPSLLPKAGSLVKAAVPDLAPVAEGAPAGAGPSAALAPKVIQQAEAAPELPSSVVEPAQTASPQVENSLQSAEKVASETPNVNSSEPNVAQTSPEVNPGGRTAPNAPNLRSGLTPELKQAGIDAGDPTEHNIFGNAELDTAAQRQVAATDPQDILARYANGVPPLQDAANLAHAKNSLPVLANLTKDANPETAEAAKAAIDNVLQGAEQGVSKAGRTMNYAQSLYDSLPREVQVPQTIRALDKARIAAGLDPIHGSADEQAVAAQIDALLAKGEDLSQKGAAVEGKIQEIMQGAKGGNVPENAAADLRMLQKQYADLQIQSQAQNGATVRYYNSLLPGKAGLQKAADFARTSMLTAPTGRINNFFNVGGNSLHEIARSIPQATLNKAVELFRPGATESKSLLNRGLVSGFRSGLKASKAEFSGEQLVKAGPQEAKVESTEVGARNYDLTKATGKQPSKFGNLVRAAVKAPSRIVGGAIHDAQLERSAAQEAAQAGLKGEDAKVYAQARAIIPSREMEQRAQQLQDTVSHMNKNPFADMAGKILNEGKIGGNKGGLVGLIKNALIPFPKYAATFAWNTLTDRNVVADAVRLGKALKAGDLNAVTKAVSGGALGTGAMYVAYHLAQQGLITNKDGNGYSDDGAYLHVGNRYIPLGTLGVNAEPLLAGAAMYNAFNKGGDVVSNITNTVVNTIFDTVKAAGAQNLVGAGEQGLTEAQKALTGSDGVTAGDAAAVLGGQAAGQFIPGAFSDVNAALNGMQQFNPTGEAAETKVTKGSEGVKTATGQVSTAKDVGPSELKSLENRIPGLSQTLPRSPGTTATDLIDRTTRGSHVGTAQNATLQKTQDAADQVKADQKAGIPDPNGKYTDSSGKSISFSDEVEATVEKGDYQKAIKGLQEQLSGMGGQPETKTLPVQHQIEQLTYLDNNKLPATFRSTYKDTTLAEWRAMGDPTSSSYDPKTYQDLYNYDQAMIKTGAGGASLDSSTAKYYPKSGSSGSGSSKGLSAIKTPGSLSKLTLGNLKAVKATPAKVTLSNTSPQEMIKARTISVKQPSLS